MLMPGLISFSIAVLTIAFHAYKASIVNPTISLVNRDRSSY
jgi:hypothetical protein